MKSVLISIQPKWCAKIASGTKTIEVRKTAPKIATPFKCYIYCTKGNPNDPHQRLETHATNGKIKLANGTVFAEFICDRITTTAVWRLLDKTGKCAKRTDAEKEFPELACLTIPEIREYAGSNQRIVYGWHISDLVIYDKPKELYEFYKCGAATVEELDEQLCNYCVRTDYGEHRSSLTPNGYWSCEGAWCDEAYREYLDTEYVLTRPPQSWCYVERGNDNA
jgi:hypothetical protein